MALKSAVPEQTIGVILKTNLKKLGLGVHCHRFPSSFSTPRLRMTVRQKSTQGQGEVVFTCKLPVARGSFSHTLMKTFQEEAPMSADQQGNVIHHGQNPAVSQTDDRNESWRSGKRCKEYLDTFSAIDNRLRLPHGGFYNQQTAFLNDDGYRLGTLEANFPLELRGRQTDPGTARVDIDWVRAVFLVNHLTEANWLHHSYSTLSKAPVRLSKLGIPENYMRLDVAVGPGLLYVAKPYTNDSDDVPLTTQQKAEQLHELRAEMIREITEKSASTLCIEPNSDERTMCSAQTTVTAALLGRVLHAMGFKVFYYADWGCKADVDDYRRFDELATAANNFLRQDCNNRNVPEDSDFNCNFNQFDCSRNFFCGKVVLVGKVPKIRTMTDEPSPLGNQTPHVQVYPQMPGFTMKGYGGTQTLGRISTVPDVMCVTIYGLGKHKMKAEGGLAFEVKQTIRPARESLRRCCAKLDKWVNNPESYRKQQGARVELRIGNCVTTRGAMDICLQRDLHDLPTLMTAMGQYQTETRYENTLQQHDVSWFPLLLVQPEVFLAHAIRVVQAARRVCRGRSHEQTTPSMKLAMKDAYASVGWTKPRDRPTTGDRLGLGNEDDWFVLQQEANWANAEQLQGAAAPAATQPVGSRVGRRRHGSRRAGSRSGRGGSGNGGGGSGSGGGENGGGGSGSGGGGNGGGGSGEGGAGSGGSGGVISGGQVEAAAGQPRQHARTPLLRLGDLSESRRSGSGAEGGGSGSGAGRSGNKGKAPQRSRGKENPSSAKRSKRPEGGGSPLVSIIDLTGDLDQEDHISPTDTDGRALKSEKEVPKDVRDRMRAIVHTRRPALGRAGITWHQTTTFNGRGAGGREAFRDLDDMYQAIWTLYGVDWIKNVKLKGT